MRKTKLLIALATIGFAGAASATDGYFSHGNGMIAKGMGGAATAMAEDTFGGANNPASMVWVGDRMDAGLDFFSPQRSASRTDVPPAFPNGLGGAVPVQINGSSESGMNYFGIPEFGYNKMINPNLALGVSVYGNGGMNTSYDAQPGAYTCYIPPGIMGPGAATFAADNLLCGHGKLGMNLMQLIIAPTASYKLNDSHSIGFSPLFGYQRFKATGLDAFGMISSDPTNLTNRGDSDDASGWGARIGWQGKFGPNVVLGAAYSTKIDMGKFSKYQGLFAGQGDFDVPENYNLGVAFKPMPNLTVAVDYQRINYSGINAIGNSSQSMAGMLGDSSGPGFGWKDVNVFKLGFQYKMDDKITLRAGYNHADNPIRSDDVTFNILAPGVVEDHITLGMTYVMSKTSDLTVSYMHAFENSVSGASNPVYFPVMGTDTIKMYQDSIGIAYSWKM